MRDEHPIDRRRAFAKAGRAAGSTALGGSALAPAFDFKPHQHRPDLAVQILNPGSAKYRIHSSTLEQVAGGLRRAEGPVCSAGGGHLLVSDILDNRIRRSNEKGGGFTAFRQPSRHASGNARDRQGRLLACERLVARRVTRTEPGGKSTVLADSFEGKELDAPNGTAVKSDDRIGFTDPLFGGIHGEQEGSWARPEQATTSIYRLGSDGKLAAVVTESVNPDGLAFLPDEERRCVVERKGTPKRRIWSLDLNAKDVARGKTKPIDADAFGALGGFQVDCDDNLWCGWGSNGALQTEPTERVGRKVFQLKGSPEAPDGVKILSPQGRAIGFIALPERCANPCFAGSRHNRLYRASSHSLPAPYVEAHGAA